MNRAKKQGSWVIIISLLIAYMLTAMPLPDFVTNWRPAWVAMVVIYWCMALPHRIGIAISWGLGLLLDVQQGTVLGQNALGLALLAWLTIKYHQRIRVFPLFQQAILICMYILLFQFIVLWIKGAMGLAPQDWTFWMPALTSGLLWPWIFIIMRDIRRKYRIT